MGLGFRVSCVGLRVPPAPLGRLEPGENAAQEAVTVFGTCTCFCTGTSTTCELILRTCVGGSGGRGAPHRTGGFKVEIDGALRVIELEERQGLKST